MEKKKYFNGPIVFVSQALTWLYLAHLLVILVERKSNSAAIDYAAGRNLLWNCNSID